MTRKTIVKASSNCVVAAISADLGVRVVLGRVSGIHFMRRVPVGRSRADGYGREVRIIDMKNRVIVVV